MKKNIWNISIEIDTNNQGIRNDILNPSAHSLRTNWRYSMEPTTDIRASIVLNRSKSQVRTIVEWSHLEVTWDINYWIIKWSNPQFLSTWNKWIMSKFISHICEKSWIISLHACALFDPITWKTMIWVGPSWSWKTAFISAAIVKGYSIVATEMLQIDQGWRILLWNTFDVIWASAIEFFKKRENLKVPVFEDDTIFDQTWSKCLSDFSIFWVPDWIELNIDNSDIVFLQFGNEKFSDWMPVIDNDMSLRFIGNAASEKLETPTYIDDNIVGTPIYWDPWFRNEMIHVLNTKVISKVILGWNMDDFWRFLERE